MKKKKKPIIVVWFSCGAASAVAAKLTVEKFGMDHEIIIANTPVDEEGIASRCKRQQKYRKKVLTGQVAEKVRELIREICKANDIEIIKGHVSKDHVHLFVSIPPHLLQVLAMLQTR